MKNISYLGRFIGLALGLAIASASSWAAAVGSPAPDFTLTDLDGHTQRLSDLKGKTVVLEWVNPECPFVRRHYESGNMPTLQKEATAEGVVWLSINSAAPGNEGDFDATHVRTWSASVKAAPTAYFRDQDGHVGHLYGAKTTPHMYVINPQGVLVYQGAIDSDRRRAEGAVNYVRAALAAVKSGNTVEKPVTDPYGCSVKY